MKTARIEVLTCACGGKLYLTPGKCDTCKSPQNLAVLQYISNYIKKFNASTLWAEWLLDKFQLSIMEV